jgi:hypothetical protein
MKATQSHMSQIMFERQQIERQLYDKFSIDISTSKQLDLSIHGVKHDSKPCQQ